MPKVVSTYFEPFLGSGSFLFYVLQQQLNHKITIRNKIVASDFNADLINFFQTLQRAPLNLNATFVNSFVLPFNRLKSKEAKKLFYNEVKADFNKHLGFPSIQQAARFLFLNKTCYGSMFRVDSNGFFSGAFGNRPKPAFPNESLLMSASKLININKVRFLHEKFDTSLIKSIHINDFIFLDPPYMKVTGSEFVNYLSPGFSDEDSLSLLRFCDRLTEKGRSFTLSNSIAVARFVEKSRFVNKYKTVRYCTKSFNGNLEQLLITNYPGAPI